MNKVLIALLTLSISAVNAQKNSSKQPNIIVVLADDIGVGDISKYRSMHTNDIKIQTPNIDQLALSGMTFTNAHAPATLCATSRYAIMTGNHNYRSPLPWGVWSAYNQSVFTAETLTLGRVMKKANYQTAFIGKWHMGTSFSKKSDPAQIYEEVKNTKEQDVDISTIVDGGPSQNGFDYNFTLPAGIQSVPYAAYENDKMYPLKPNSKIGFIDAAYMEKLGHELDKKEGHGDSNWDPSLIGPLIVNKAVSFIEKNANKKQPFFMYYCSQAVHAPHAPAAELNGIKIAGTTPSKHMDMIKELDVQMGMLIENLKKQGIYENTVFIFTSDNGGLHTDGDTWNARHEPSDIYRGCKNDPYEGGSRVPFLVSWPGVVKPNSTTSKTVLGLDILATIAAISNQKIDKNQALDSYNLLPILKEEKNSTTHPFLMLQGGSGKEGMIVDGDWKIIIQFDPKDKDNTSRTPIALFNLKENPWEHEEFNFINEPKYKNKIQELLTKYNTTRDSGVATGKH